ncbi:MAG: hypothetical protein ABIM50_09280 [Novosphingobium sp.]
MARVTTINKPGDYPGTPDEATRADLAALFAGMFPGNPDPEINPYHAGIAIAAHSPKLASGLAGLSKLMALDLGWSQRTDLRELAILAANLQFKSDYGFRSRLPNARAAGLTDEQLAALPDWETTRLFDDEQKLVIAYALAVASGRVAPELFERVKARWGQRGAVECTAVISFWGCWAMFLNATGAELG